MLDVNEVPLASEHAIEAYTGRSRHALSGRCGLAVRRPTEKHDYRNAARRNGSGDAPAPEMSLSHEYTILRSPDDYRTWEVDFYLQATGENPRVLLSVAPHYLPFQSRDAESGRFWRPPTAEDQEMYDKRMLETSFIWEEPMTLSVDCTTNGIFLWSEEWIILGEKIADKCFSRRIQGRGGDDRVDNASLGSVVREGPYEAFVRLSWRMMSDGENDACGGEKCSLNDLSLPNTFVGPRHGEVAVFLRTSSSEQEDEDVAILRQRHGSGRVGACGGESVSSGVQVWKRAGGCAVSGDDVPDGVHFTPYVTLMDAGDDAIL
ncbi:hypothetical protein TRSC58_00462 [Trypanosoma rangeli SC58]|uniref:Uncharacterized protein n=1 Tax=Trypanosoma rangeli SC58 TaxID=429131 RepID=A0A061JBP5_TRYRA|nr:hypothetical protein TRSC58_00462 [Trypanosoma rangeli SC58]